MTKKKQTAGDADGDPSVAYEDGYQRGMKARRVIKVRFEKTLVDTVHREGKAHDLHKHTIHPACPAAEQFLRLTGRQTFSVTDLRAIEALGYTIERVET